MSDKNNMDEKKDSGDAHNPKRICMIEVMDAANAAFKPQI